MLEMDSAYDSELDKIDRHCQNVPVPALLTEAHQVQGEKDKTKHMLQLHVP
jgi:hypothetical protein